MADKPINTLPVKSLPAAGDKMLMIGSAEEYQIDYDQLASAILDKLATKQYSELDTTAKTVLGALDELNGKTYLLQGGTAIPENADMDTYTTPGNYYVISNTQAATLSNSPFENNSFILKVEYANGITYPRQIFTEYSTGRKAIRFISSSGGSWSDWLYFSDDATLANNLLSTAPYTVAFDEIAPGASQTKSVSVHRDGYKAIGCVGWANTKSFDFYLYQCIINKNETLSAFIRSVSDSTITGGASVIVNVLFVKNS